MIVALFLLSRVFALADSNTEDNVRTINAPTAAEVEAQKKEATTYNYNDGFIVLEDPNFLDAIDDLKELIVIFEMNNCEHCTSVKEVFQMFKEQNPDAKVAVLNRTTDREIPAYYGIHSFPTVMHFYKTVGVAYDGEHSADKLIKWARAKMAPLEEVNAEQLGKIKSDKRRLYVFYGESGSTAAQMVQAATKFHDFNVAAVYNPDIIAELGIKATPTFICYKQYNDKQAVTYDGDWSSQAELQKWMFVQSFSWASEYKKRTLDLMFEYQTPVLLLIGKHDAIADDLGKKFGYELPVITVQDFKQGALSRFAEFLGISNQAKNVAMIVDTRDGSATNFKKYLFDKTIRLEDLKTFVESWKTGEASQLRKTQAKPPETDDTIVKILVGQTFDEVVYDETKEVLVAFVASWCKHCVKLVKVLEELAEKLPKVIFATIDAMENDIADQEITVFPTIKFFPKGGKQTCALVDSPTVESIEGFITKCREAEQTEDAPQKGKKEDL